MDWELGCSDEAKEVVEDNLEEVAKAVIAAYDSGELQAAVDGGPEAWQKWIKGLGKTFKRKVILYSASHVDGSAHQLLLFESSHNFLCVELAGEKIVYAGTDCAHRKNAWS